jgi:hypothetical protein
MTQHFQVARLAARQIGAKGRTATMAAALAASAAGIASCASSGSTASATNAADASAPQQRSSRYVLVESDLRAAQADNLYDAILKLRPEFLNGRGGQSGLYPQPSYGGTAAPSPGSGSAVLTNPPAVMVYRDKARLTGVDDLRQIMLSQVREVRYLPGPEAAVKFGTNNSAGAIIVTSK